MNKYWFIVILIILILLFSFFVHKSFGQSLIQKTLQSSIASSVSLSFPSNTTQGNLIILAVSSYISQITSVSDLGHNTFTQVPNSPQTNSSDRVYLYYAKNIAGGSDNITVNFDSANHIKSLGVYEYSGLDKINPFDKSNGGIGSTTTVSPGLVTPANNNSLIFSVGNDYATNETSIVTPAAGYILEDQIDNSNTSERYYTQDLIQTTAASTTALFTTTLAGHNEAVVAVFKPAPLPTPTLTPTSSFTPTPSPAFTPTPTPTLSINHIVVVFEEDHELQQVLSTDYFTSLANQGALMVNSHGITHPSTPNYFAFISGSTQGLIDNTCPPPGSPFSASNLGSQLISANLTFTGYYEQPSVNCVGTFAWEWFSNIPLSDSILFTSFPTDYNSLPTVSFVLPNLQDNMHDGTIQQASNWLKANIDAYKTWTMLNNSLLIVTTDEEDGVTDRPVYTVFVGPMIKKGIYNELINHYNVLSTIEAKYSLPQLNTALPITDIFQ